MRSYRRTGTALLTLGLLSLSPLAAHAAEAVDLSVSVMTTGGSRADAPVEYTVTLQSAYTDTGEEVADVAVGFTVPDGASVVEVRPHSPSTTTCTVARCAVTGLRPGGYAAVDVLVRVPQAGSWALTATLEPRAIPDADPANDTDTESTEVLAPLPAGTIAVRPLPAVIAYGDTVRSQGTLRRADGTVPREYTQVSLEARAPGAAEFTPTQSTSGTDASGGFGLQLDTSVARDYRWVWRGDGDHGRTVSAVLSVRPVVRPAVTMDPVRVPPGGTSTVVATVAGPVAGRTASFQRWNGSSWVAFASRAVSRPGTLKVPAARLAAGTHRFRVVLSGPSSVPSGQGVLSVSMWGKGDARSYAFMQESRPGVPIRWNPCAAIGYRVNPAQAPAGGVADVHEALRRVALASGLVFRYLGTTTHIPQDVDDRRNPAQITIAWARPGQSQMLYPGVAGVGGAVASYVGRGYRYTMGAVVLNSTERLDPGFGRGATEGSLVMHEVAHAIGLDHVNTRFQIMEPMMDNDADAAMWGAGDLQGFKRIGRAAGCM